MTATLEEVSTVHPLEEARLAAAEATGIIALGGSFTIPPGYTPVAATSPVPEDIGPAERAMLITRVALLPGEDGTAEGTARATAAYLGRTLPSVYVITGPSSGERIYVLEPRLSLGGLQLPRVQVFAAKLRSAALSERPADGELICFSDGLVGRYHSVNSDALAVEVVDAQGRHATGAMVSIHRTVWVPVTADAVEPSPALAATVGSGLPVFTVPDGWELRCTDVNTYRRETGNAVGGDRGHRVLIGPRSVQEEDWAIPDEAIGKVVLCRPASDEDRWFVRPGQQNVPATWGAFFARGAVLNPRVDGAILLDNGLIVTPTEWHMSGIGSTAFRCRVEETTTDLSLFVPGSIYFLDSRTTSWVAVTRTTAAGESPAEPAAEEREYLGFENTLGSYPFNGCAVPEADGQFLKNPAMEDGQLYLFWNHTADPDRRHDTRVALFRYTAPAEGAEHGLLYRVAVMNPNDLPRNTTRRMTGVSSVLGADYAAEHTSWWWVKATEPEAEETQLLSDPSYRTDLGRLKARREEYIQKTNDLASENDWCSEYETIVQRLGFPGRKEQTVDVRAEVRADFTLTISNPSGHLDDQMDAIVFDSDAHGLSLSEVTTTGSIIVQVDVDNIPLDEDGDIITDNVEEEIDDDMVEQAISNALRHSGTVEVDSFTVESASRR